EPVRIVRRDELREEREEEQGQLRVEHVDGNGGADYPRRGAAAAVLFVDAQRALLAQRTPGEIEQVRHPEVLQGLKSDRARIEERSEPHDRGGHVRDDAERAPERCDDACATA